MVAEEQPGEEPEAHAQQLREEVEELVRRARLLLRGEHLPEAPKSPAPERAERERELELALEKADSLQREIKRMRAELTSRDHMGPVPTHAPSSVDRDPLELQNRVAEKRRELRRLKRQGEPLDEIAARQQQAQAAQNAMSPEVEERLQDVKREVENQKRNNARLQSERLKLSASRKAVEKELRAAGSELKVKAAMLQKPQRSSPSNGANGVLGSPTVRQLRHELDILRGAMASDERRLKSQCDSADRGVERAEAELASLRSLVSEREADLQRLQQEFRAAGELRCPRGMLQTPCERTRTPAERSPGREAAG